MTTFLSAFMWVIAGVSIILILLVVFGSFLQEKDKADAYKYLAEKERSKNR